MEKNCRFSYNEIDDSFAVSCREENENIKENFAVDNFIFSLTGKGKIVGLQIKDFSKILSESNVSESIAGNIKNAVMLVLKKENCLFVGLKLTLGAKQVNLSLGRIFMPQITAR